MFAGKILRKGTCFFLLTDAFENIDLLLTTVMSLDRSPPKSKL